MLGDFAYWENSGWESFQLWNKIEIGWSSCTIRESVDSLYRDDTGEISRDPRTKRLKTR